MYPREQPRHHLTSTQRENTNPHHIGTTRPYIHQTPPEADHKSQLTITHTQLSHQKRTYDGCRTSPPKAEITRGTPSQKRTDTTRHLPHSCPKGLGLTCQRHLITPTIPQNVSQKPYLKQGTTTSTTSHVPPAEQPCTNRSHSTATIETLSKKSKPRKLSGQQEDFHSNQIEAGLKSIVWLPLLLDHVMLLNVSNQRNPCRHEMVRCPLQSQNLRIKEIRQTCS